MFTKLNMQTAEQIGMKLLTQTIAKLAVLAGVVGSGALITSPALADSHLNSSDSSTLQQTQMGQPEPMQETEMGQPSATTNSIVDIASSNQSFNTLVQAVQAAGLTDTLSSEGSYTVFAPTDEAFSQLPEGTLEYLLQPENQDLLRQILTYHVVPNEVTSNDIATGPVEALSGGLAVRVAEDGRVIVNNASVVDPDIQASNGVIHVVNRVLIPETLQRTLEARLNVQSIYQ